MKSGPKLESNQNYLSVRSNEASPENLDSVTRAKFKLMLARDTSDISVSETITLKQFMTKKTKKLEKIKELKCQAADIESR